MADSHDPNAPNDPQPLQRSNDRVYNEAREGITRQGLVDASDINVRVEHGEVFLEGTVPSSREKQMAEEDVQSLPGIESVHNRLQVSPPQADLRSHIPSQLASVSGPAIETLDPAGAATLTPPKPNL